MGTKLVTGASGFIGQHLAAALFERGDEVACLVRHTSRVDELKQFSPRFVYGDITDADSLVGALEDVDVVYHLAGLTKALREADLFAANELGTRNVVAAAAAQPNPPVVVIVSSLAAAGPSIGGRPRTEADPPEPVSKYGCSKLAGERAAIEFAGDVPITIIRPPIVVGQGDTASLELYRPIVRFGLHLIPGFADHRYSIVHADDLARALILAAESGDRVPPDSIDGATGRFFATDSATPTYAELGSMVAEAFRAPRYRARHVPNFLVRTIAATSQLAGWLRRRPPVFNLDKAREATAGSWTCSPAAIQTLGFRPAMPLRDRLAETAKWYLEKQLV